MSVLLYYEKAQSEFYEKIAVKVEKIKSVNSLSQLESIYNPDECPILIIVSQPTNELWVKLQHLKFSSIFVYIGVRVKSDIKQPILTFSDDIELQHKMSNAKMKQLSDIHERYLSYLSPLNEEEVAYLELYLGIPVENKHKRVDHRIKKIAKKRVNRKGTVAIMATASHTIDFAKVLSKKLSGKIVIVDGNLMKPTLDAKLRLNSIYSDVKSHLIGLDNTGINIALDLVSKQMDFGEHIERCTKRIAPHTYVLLGNYNIYNYEHYDDALLKMLVKKLETLFDIVLLHIGDNPYDVFTMMALHHSDLNVLYCGSDVSQIRYYNNVLDVLSYKQGIPRNKTLVSSENQKGVFQESIKRHIFQKQYMGYGVNKLVRTVLERL